jgi:hypothetical protein
MRARRRNHARVELDHAHARRAQAAMEEFRERAPAQADHHRLARLRMEQQESHHAARIVERQRVRVVEAHRALDRLAADVQLAQAAPLAHGDHPRAFHAAARVRRISTSTRPAPAKDSADAARMGTA